MSYFRLLAIFLRIGIMNEAQYRVNFFVQLGQSLIALATGLIALALVFDYTDALGGWGPNELLAVMGVHILMGGVIKLIVQPNMQRLLGDIQQGTLDYVLTKPEDAQLLISVREVRFWQVVDFALGGVVLGIALSRLQGQVGWTAGLAFAAALILGAVLIYSFWLMLSTCAFWFVRVENIQVIFLSMYQAGRWPVTIYPGWLRWILTFLVPVAFATTVPAQAFSGTLDLDLMLAAVGLAIALLIASRLFWRYGIRFYSGASA